MRAVLGVRAGAQQRGGVQGGGEQVAVAGAAAAGRGAGTQRVHCSRLGQAAGALLQHRPGRARRRPRRLQVRMPCVLRNIRAVHFLRVCPSAQVKNTEVSLPEGTGNCFRAALAVVSNCECHPVVPEFPEFVH